MYRYISGANGRKSFAIRDVLIVVANRNWVTNGNLSGLMIDFSYSNCQVPAVLAISNKKREEKKNLNSVVLAGDTNILQSRFRLTLLCTSHLIIPVHRAHLATI